MMTIETKHEAHYGTFTVTVEAKGAITHTSYKYDGRYGMISCNTLNGLIIGLTKVGCIVPINDMRAVMNLAY